MRELGLLGTDEAEHLDGVPWWDAPRPRRWHRCYAHSTGWVGMTQVWRCPCGAIRMPLEDGKRHPWLDRNSRKRTRRN